MSIPEASNELINNILNPSILITLISLAATVAGLVLRVRMRRDDAFEEYRRCQKLIRLITDKYERLYEKMIDITLCLKSSRDRSEVRNLLFRYSNMLGELEEFWETGCPEIHSEIDNIAKRYIATGSIYITLGLALILSGPKALGQAIFAIIYGLFGLYLLHDTNSKAVEKIENYKLELDSMYDNLNIIEDNLKRLEKQCPQE